MGTLSPNTARIITMTAELEWCSEASGEAKCLEEDTLIVLAYAAFCVALGLVVALLVIWADKARGSKTRAKVADNVESNVRTAAEEELEEVYRSVTKLENVHRKISAQFTIDRNGLGTDNE